MRKPKPKLRAEPVKLDRQGYTRSGKYFGVGEKLWRVTDEEGTLDTHVRAQNATKAKQAIALPARPTLDATAPASAAAKSSASRRRIGGYTPCACRDCMDTAVSRDMKKPDLCNDCEDAGCSKGAGECQRDDAYGG